MSNRNAVAVIARLKELLQVESDSALCEVINVSPQTLSSWKTRDKVPYAICVDYSQIADASLDWLLTGEGPMKKDFSRPFMESITNQERCWIELFRDLPEETQKNILRDAEKEKRLLELEREVQLLKEASPAPPKQKNTG